MKKTLKISLLSITLLFVVFIVMFILIPNLLLLRQSNYVFYPSRQSITDCLDLPEDISINRCAAAKQLRGGFQFNHIFVDMRTWFIVVEIDQANCPDLKKYVNITEQNDQNLLSYYESVSVMRELNSFIQFSKQNWIMDNYLAGDKLFYRQIQKMKFDTPQVIYTTNNVAHIILSIDEENDTATLIFCQ